MKWNIIWWNFKLKIQISIGTFNLRPRIFEWFIFKFSLRDTPEELVKIQELEEQVETLKMETRNRLKQNIDKKYEELSGIRSLHEKEIETMTRQIDTLQEQLGKDK